MNHLSKSAYLDKMRGCWLGKAIGGTMGAIFEARRGAWDLEYYPESIDLKGGMLPNDDLDLQLIWLNAAERYKTELSAEKLTDYWMLGILPNWAEYGVGKSNMRMGLCAPSSGKFNNRFCNSNGAWIRAEIWACLAPGHPEIAVKYALEDACTDHADEGVYAEIFMAALESAAFVENDTYKLIDIALSYIPQDCDCTRAVKTIIELYQSGIDWKETRIKLLNAFPDSFGGQWGEIDPNVENGNWGYDAPANLALTLIGWLYAGDDFGKAICITAGCGEDGDCTTGALGAIFGILLGENGIPAIWKDPIGREIKTICCNTFVSSIRIPKTIDELATRTLRLVPSFLGESVDLVDDARFVSCQDSLLSIPNYVINDTNGFDARFFRDAIPTGYVFRASSPLMNVMITAREGIEVASGTELNLDLKIENATSFCGAPLYTDIRWFTPEGMYVEGGNEYTAFVNQQHCGSGRNLHSVKLKVECVKTPVTTVICELTVRGFASKIYLPVTLICAR